MKVQDRYKVHGLELGYSSRYWGQHEIQPENHTKQITIETIPRIFRATNHDTNVGYTFKFARSIVVSDSLSSSSLTTEIGIGESDFSRVRTVDIRRLGIICIVSCIELAVSVPAVMSVQARAGRSVQSQYEGHLRHAQKQRQDAAELLEEKNAPWLSEFTKARYGSTALVGYSKTVDGRIHDSSGMSVVVERNNSGFVSKLFETAGRCSSVDESFDLISAYILPPDNLGGD